MYNNWKYNFYHSCRYYATAPITTTPPTNKSTEDSKTKKRITVEEQIAQLQKSAEARQGVFEIETPKLYPPPQGGVSGARRYDSKDINIFYNM